MFGGCEQLTQGAGVGGARRPPGARADLGSPAATRSPLLRRTGQDPPRPPHPQRALLWPRAPQGGRPWGPGASRCCCPAGRPEEPLSHRCCCSSDPCCEEQDSRPENNGFLFLYKMETKIQEKLPLLTSECNPLPCLRFLRHRVVFGPGDGPAGSPGSDPGWVFASPPFTCIKKKKKKDGLKNVLRKKNVLFYK